MSKTLLSLSLLSLLAKEVRSANSTFGSVKKSNMRDLLVNRANRSQNKRLSYVFWHTVFSLLFPFLCPRANHSCCSSLSRSSQKSDNERIAPVALYKRVNMSDSLQSLRTKERHEQLALFHSCAHNKRAKRVKKRRAKSQLCRNIIQRYMYTNLETLSFI